MSRAKLVGVLVLGLGSGLDLEAGTRKIEFYFGEFVERFGTRLWHSPTRRMWAIAASGLRFHATIR